MQKEIRIYKLLSKIQGIYIPELVCYGYYGAGWDMLWVQQLLVLC